STRTASWRSPRTAPPPRRGSWAARRTRSSSRSSATTSTSRSAETQPAPRSAGFAAPARGADGAILSDYGYGAIAPAAVAALRASLPSGARIFVDSRHRLADFAGVDAATPNEEELEESAGTVLDSDEALASAGARLRSRMRCACLLVTRGSRG